MNKVLGLCVLIVVFSFTMGVYFYPGMPDRLASHWGSTGDVNGYMGKFWGLFLLPIILAVLLPILIFIPKLDPMKKNYESFKKKYDGFILIICLFLFYVYLLTIFWNLGFSFSMISFLIPAFSILFYYLGYVIAGIKRNWFVGIRTPWTLSSDVVWDKTHRLGGKLFKTFAIVILLGLFFIDWAIWILIVPIFAIVVYLFVYSYLVWRKIGGKSL